jgi:hypothetical protein
MLAVPGAIYHLVELHAHDVASMIAHAMDDIAGNDG